MEEYFMKFFCYILYLVLLYSIQVSKAEDFIFTCPVSFTIRECNRQQKAYNAVLNLHKLLDANKDGGIDLKETNGFISEELSLTVPSERVQKLYESDNHINPRELWDVWTNSETYNWTIKDMTDWLVNTVDLPQFVNQFRENEIDGKALPLLIDPSGEFLSNVLGIRSLIYRQKLILKALDCILFGPPRATRTIWIDIFSGFLIIFFSSGLAFSYVQQKNSKQQMKRMAQELEDLNAVVKFMTDIREQSEEYYSQNMWNDSGPRSQLQLAGLDPLDTVDETSEVEHLKTKLGQTEREICYLRRLLLENEKCREKNDHFTSYNPNHNSHANLTHNFLLSNSLEKSLSLVKNNSSNQLHIASLLKTWLQITFEVESSYYNYKKMIAERCVREAQENHEKFRKKASNVWGTFKYAHDSTFELIEKDICKAKTSLDTIKQDLCERAERWSEIQRLLGVTIVPTPGLQVLRNHISRMKNLNFMSPSHPTLQKIDSTSSLLGLHFSADNKRIFNDDNRSSLSVSERSSWDTESPKWSLFEHDSRNSESTQTLVDIKSQLNHNGIILKKTK